jgi:uncharacterized repeat protein (TIGR03803 family)
LRKSEGRDRFRESGWRTIMLRKTFFGERSAMLALLVLGVLVGAALAQKESVLYSFCAQYNCNDGEFPQAGLLLDQKGNLYGTTSTGGPYDECGNHGGEGCGLVFKLGPKGKETVLYDFCERGYPCTDGYNPAAGLVFDEKGNLYGTTRSGGAYGAGVVFRLTPEGKETVLYSFCAQSKCADGYYPAAGLVFDQKGNLYGTAEYGGAYNGGVVFKLTPRGKYAVLHSFCSQSGCTDGEYPAAGLVFDLKGNLYGTTAGGGASNCDGSTCGVVFKLTPKGTETVVYSFCSQSGCTDGEYPAAGLVFDLKGNLYGTTASGGERYAGVVFKLTPKGKETVLYRGSLRPEGKPVWDDQLGRGRRVGRRIQAHAVIPRLLRKLGPPMLCAGVSSNSCRKIAIKLIDHSP